MTKVNACLLLSHAFNHRNRRLPKGMRERFIARAIKEGVTLKPASTVGRPNLGLASAVFIILLVTAAAIRTGPFSRPVVDANHFDAAQLSKPVQVKTPISLNSTVSLLRRRRNRSRGAKSRSVQVQWRLDPSGALPSHLETFQNRYFPAALSSPHFLLAAMPSNGGRLSSWPYVPSRFSLAAGPGLIRESALRLLADSEYGTANPMTLPSEFTFATPGAGFHPSLDRDLYRNHPIFEFRDTPLKFHFVGNVTQ
jgi:hypothetical protein